MNLKDKLPNIGSLLKLILSHSSQLLRDKLPLARDFAYMATNGFIGAWFSNLTIRQLIINNL